MTFHFSLNTPHKTDLLGSIRDMNYLDRHISSILRLDEVDLEGIKKRNFKIVIDGINSSGGLYVPYLLQKMNIETIGLNCVPDGCFAHDPEPIPENLKDLCDKVKACSADLGIAVDPAAGPSDAAFPVSLGGSGVSTSVGAAEERADVNLVIAATAPSSGVTTLVVHRKGIGGGEELDADASLIVYNLTESSNVDLAVSGANIAIADMNIAISGVVGVPTGIMPTFIKGYQD